MSEKNNSRKIHELSYAIQTKKYSIKLTDSTNNVQQNFMNFNLRKGLTGSESLEKKRERKTRIN